MGGFSSVAVETLQRIRHMGTIEPGGGNTIPEHAVRHRLVSVETAFSFRVHPCAE